MHRYKTDTKLGAGKKTDFNRYRCLSWDRSEYRDPYEPKYYTAISCAVMSPTYDRPWASLLVSVANAGGKTTLRFATLEAAQKYFVLSPHCISKMIPALAEANRMADEIEADLRLSQQRRRLPQGVGLARTDTGEIVSEAERILDAH